MVTLSYVFFLFVTLSVFYNLYDEIVVNYFAHAHTGHLSLRGLESGLQNIMRRIIEQSCYLRISTIFDFEGRGGWKDVEIKCEQKALNILSPRYLCVQSAV